MDGTSSTRLALPQFSPLSNWLLSHSPCLSCPILPLPPLPHTVAGTFLNTLKFAVKDCDPISGEVDDEDGPGYDDEYVVSGTSCPVYMQQSVNAPVEVKASVCSSPQCQVSY